VRQGRVIVLNGTSSAGKTTLAKALREALPEPFCYYASDQLADGGFRAISGKVPDAATHDERSRFFDGFHRSIAAFAEAGNDMIVEHIVEEQSWARQLDQLLAPFDTFWIGVHAPVAELERRENARGDRSPGEARYHLRTHGYCRYDLEVDSCEPRETVVAAIVAAWTSRSMSAS
jgi:chloramphenicol 3-O phosphotransferase